MNQAARTTAMIGVILHNCTGRNRLQNFFKCDRFLDHPLLRVKGHSELLCGSLRESARSSSPTPALASVVYQDILHSMVSQALQGGRMFLTFPILADQATGKVCETLR